MAKQSTLEAWRVQPAGVAAAAGTVEQFAFDSDCDELFTEEELLAGGGGGGGGESFAGFDRSAGRLWVYPTNYPVRQYQLSIVRAALFANTLVCLPTGLGKTFIAAVVMHNLYRWYPSGKVVFLAPTKPLVSQQIEACHNIMGIPQTHFAEMTGSLPPRERTGMWSSKRVFFLTPQVMQNDLARGACPARQVRCVVFDEAHKALGNHAYCQVMSSLSGCVFRVLALSATPGSDLKAVQQVVSNLHIAHIELRTEEDPDVRRYVNERQMETVVVPLEGEIAEVRNTFCHILERALNRLTDMRVLYACHPNSLSKYQLLQARDAFRNNPTKHGIEAGAVESFFALAISLCHAYDLLQQHGMLSFYRFLTSSFAQDSSKMKREVYNSPAFRTIVERLKKQIQAPTFFYSHPKLLKLEEIVLQHFSQAADDTRVMIFSQYRDSVEEIAELLSSHSPVMKVMSFVGHAGKSGLSQKKQSEVVRRFREGQYNTLVATCVGEEGLDIGEVDLIVCFDAHKSPVRLVQRMGRTGRKRRGRIVTIVTEGKEHKVFGKSHSQKKRIDKAVCEGCKRLTMYPSSPRMVPTGITPQLHKMHMNTSFFVNNSKPTERTRVSKNPLLSAEELAEWSEKMALPDGKTRAIELSMKTILAEPVLCSLRATSGRSSGAALGRWVHWQTAPSSCKLIAHSERSQHLLAVLQLIDELTTPHTQKPGENVSQKRPRSSSQEDIETLFCNPLLDEALTQHAVPRPPELDSLEWLDEPTPTPTPAGEQCKRPRIDSPSLHSHPSNPDFHCLDTRCLDQCFDNDSDDGDHAKALVVNGEHLQQQFKPAISQQLLASVQVRSVGECFQLMVEGW